MLVLGTTGGPGLPCTVVRFAAGGLGLLGAGFCDLHKLFEYSGQLLICRFGELAASLGR